MYAYISGELIEVNEDTVILDNHGIGYEIYTSKSVIYTLPAIGTEVKLHIYEYIREDTRALFGFRTKEELELFKLLINVNGIGPKAGLAILGEFSAQDLKFAILAEDAKTLAKAPGVGPKSAQRLIIDLKDKITDVTHEGALEASAVSAGGAMKQDVIDAMNSLGYSASQTLRAMEGMEISEEDQLEAIIKEVLKKMAFL